MITRLVVWPSRHSIVLTKCDIVLAYCWHTAGILLTKCGIMLAKCGKVLTKCGRGESKVKLADGQLVDDPLVLWQVSQST